MGYVIAIFLMAAEAMLILVKEGMPTSSQELVGLICYTLGFLLVPTIIARVYSSHQSRRTRKHFIWSFNLALFVVMLGGLAQLS